MSFDACAALVERADPLRFRAAMTSGMHARRVLFPIYAFNVEVARAPWVTQEPMIAEMRLQWWRDVLDEVKSGGTVRRHEVTDALADLLDGQGASELDGAIAARRWDIYKDAFEDQTHFDSYIDATSGGLMWTAARLLGATVENVVRDIAFGAGVAAFLQAVPALESAGRRPLIDGTSDGVRDLAQRAGDRLDRGQAAQGQIAKSARPALLSAWQARWVLQAAIADPQRVVRGDLAVPPVRDRLLLAKASLTGRV